MDEKTIQAMGRRALIETGYNPLRPEVDQLIIGSDGIWFAVDQYRPGYLALYLSSGLREEFEDGL